MKIKRIIISMVTALLLVAMFIGETVLAATPINEKYYE